MDTDSVWGVLAQIPIGTIVAWIIVSLAIISAFCLATVKLYKFFIRYKDIKDKATKQEQTIQEHSDVLKAINNSLQDIKSSLEEQKGVNLKQTRHTIVHTCEEALERKEISINKLKSLEEMYEEYKTIFNGNGYVCVLVSKVRELPVVGRIDE